MPGKSDSQKLSSDLHMQAVACLYLLVFTHHNIHNINKNNKIKIVTTVFFFFNIAGSLISWAFKKPWLQVLVSNLKCLSFSSLPHHLKFSLFVLYPRHARVSGQTTKNNQVYGLKPIKQRQLHIFQPNKIDSRPFHSSDLALLVLHVAHLFLIYLMWGSGVELKLIGLVGKYLYSLRHLAGHTLVFTLITWEYN